MPRTFRIATRKSQLAMWQAEHVRDRLLATHPGIAIELVPMSTQGDRILDVPLAKIGGKGLFVKELEAAMLDGRADLAVHSMKDVPMVFPEGLGLSTILARENPTDAFVSNSYASIDALPAGARVGTSSLRRQCQLQAARPDLEILSLRGNVNTRLSKLDAGEYDAIILASAGLIRLGMADRIRSSISTDQSLPAVGQGAVGIEIRSDDDELRQLLAPLSDADTTDCVLAERAMNHFLHGGCQVPIAGYAELDSDNMLHMRALVGATDGRRIIRAQGSAARTEAEALGRQLGQQLIEQGAQALLAPLLDSD